MRRRCEPFSQRRRVDLFGPLLTLAPLHIAALQNVKPDFRYQICGASETPRSATNGAAQVEHFNDKTYGCRT